MKLSKVRDYLNKLAEVDPEKLEEEFVIFDERTNTKYTVLSVDEGQSPTELDIFTNSDVKRMDNHGWII